YGRIEVREARISSFVKVRASRGFRLTSRGAQAFTLPWGRRAASLSPWLAATSSASSCLRNGRTDYVASQSLATQRRRRRGPRPEFQQRSVTCLHFAPLRRKQRTA